MVSLWEALGKAKEYRWVDLTHELESPPARAVWIETTVCDRNRNAGRSPPARAVWIETRHMTFFHCKLNVTAREGRCGLK